MDLWLDRRKELEFVLNLGDIIDGNGTVVSAKTAVSNATFFVFYAK